MSLDPKLLAEVVAHPKDDGPRLVLADKLTESGDPRGEFIVVGCLLADPGLVPTRRRELKKRADRLLAEHGASWVPNTAGLRYVVRRGFMDEIEADAATLLPRAANLFANEPVTRLTLTNARDVLLALANANAFARVVTLTFRGPIGDAGARTLAAALTRREAPLDGLNVGRCEIGPDGAAALASSLTGCRKLVLTGNTIGDEGVAALAKSKALAALEALYVSDNEITDEGLYALAKGGLTSLRRLAVARNEVTTDGLRALATSKKLKKVRWLEYTDEDEGEQRVAVRGA
jgi:uncharacterized protein (TIGR02996 family)